MDSATWNNYLAETWSKYLPPIRPYKEEIDLISKVIADFIESKPTPNILILGSTPELRDLVYSFNISPTVIDYNRDNYTSMSKLLKKSGKDYFIESNWVEFASEKKFDIVLSEAAFNVLSANDAKIVYKKIHDCMNPEGILIAKNWVRFSDERPDISQLIADYRGNKSEFGFYSYLCIPLMLCCYNFDTEKITLREFNKYIHDLYSSSQISLIEHQTVSVHNYDNVDLELYIPVIFSFINDMLELFTLKKVNHISIGHSEYHPVFIYERG